MYQSLGTVSADTVGKRIPIWEETHFSIQVKWAANLTATLKIRTSNLDDPDQTDTANTKGHWFEETSTFPSNPAGSAGATMQHFFNVNAKWVQFFADYSSGSGSLVETWIQTKRP